MEQRDFVYWLQGFAELNGDVPPTVAQWQMIKQHLALQFNKVTPPLATDNNKTEPIPKPQPVKDPLQEALERVKIPEIPTAPIVTTPWRPNDPWYPGSHPWPGIGGLPSDPNKLVITC